jgi:hypothetical protein
MDDCSHVPHDPFHHVVHVEPAAAGDWDVCGKRSCFHAEPDTGVGVQSDCDDAGNILSRPPLSHLKEFH